jgi:hypothetical protein
MRSTYNASRRLLRARRERPRGSGAAQIGRLLAFEDAIDEQRVRRFEAERLPKFHDPLLSSLQASS